MKKMFLKISQNRKIHSSTPLPHSFPPFLRGRGLYHQKRQKEWGFEYREGDVKKQSLLKSVG